MPNWSQRPISPSIDRDAYGRLSALLTLGKRRAPKGECELSLADLVTWSEGQLMIVIPRDERVESDVGVAQRLAEVAPGRVWLAAYQRLDGIDRSYLAGRLRCSVCGWHFPTFALGHAGKRPAFSGTHGAGTVQLPTADLGELQRSRDAIRAEEMPWVGKRKGGRKFGR